MASVLTAALMLVGFSPLKVAATSRSTNIGQNGQGTLLFVGDSLTVGSDAFGSLATRTRNTGIWTRVTVDARVGRTARAGATTVKTKTTRNTTAVVIALGTNDMLSKPEPWYPAWVIDSVMIAASGRPVLWFTLEYSANSRPEWRTRASRFNRSLVAAQSRWPQLTIADWNGFFVPNRVSRFIADGVHLTVAGYRTRATYTLRQIQLFGDAIVNATTTTSTTTTSTPTTSSTTTTTLPDSTTVAPTTSSSSSTTSSTTTSSTVASTTTVAGPTTTSP